MFSFAWYLDLGIVGVSLISALLSVLHRIFFILVFRICGLPYVSFIRSLYAKKAAERLSEVRLHGNA